MMKKVLTLFIIISLIMSAYLTRSSFSDDDSDQDETESLNSALDNNPVEAAKILENISDDTDDKINLKPLPPETAQNRAFKHGEEIVFSVKYGFITVGGAVFRVNKAQSIADRPALMITSDAWTAKFFDSVYRVRDRIISFIDADYLFSHKYIKVQREGSKKINELIKYNYSSKTATRFKSKFKKAKIEHSKNSFNLDNYIFDPFAALYYLRICNLKVGSVIKIPVSSSKDIYELNIKVEKIETINTKIGKKKCFKVKPLLLKEGIFISKGEMEVWLTADDKKIPVKMKSEIAVGSISASIESYKEK
ncbi:MAG TPA: DUF3108 domain-containing protein [bacterium]|nr:DUF3108 domain-containing protein [bacterium]